MTFKNSRHASAGETPSPVLVKSVIVSLAAVLVLFFCNLPFGFFPQELVTFAFRGPRKKNFFAHAASSLRAH